MIVKDKIQELKPIIEVHPTIIQQDKIRILDFDRFIQDIQSYHYN